MVANVAQPAGWPGGGSRVAGSLRMWEHPVVSGSLEPALPTAAGCPFVVERTGSGPPALLLHGGPGLSDYLDDLADLLGDRLECVRYTQRGVSPAPVEGPYTVAQHLADATRVLDETGVANAIVIGHSWGGYLAAELLAAHPHRVVALVSIDGLGLAGDGGWPAFDRHFEDALPASAAARVAEIDRRLVAAETTGAEADAMLGEIMQVSWPYYFAEPSSAPPPPPFRLCGAAYGDTAADAKAALEAGTLAAALRDCDVPALFLRGSHSGFPRAAVEASAALFADGRYAEIADAGHFLWVEQPAATRTAILEFLTDVGGLRD